MKWLGEHTADIYNYTTKKGETNNSRNERKHESVRLVIFFFLFVSLLLSLSLYPSPINCHLWGNTQAIVNYNATVLGLPLKDFGR